MTTLFAKRRLGPINRPVAPPIEPVAETAPPPSPDSLPATSSPASSLEGHPPLRCSFTTSDHRQCAMSVAKDHAQLCDHHARIERREAAKFLSARQAMLAEVLGPACDFRTAASVNHALGKLLSLAVTEKISPRSAGTTAYICQLLLHSLPAVQHELMSVLDYEDYKNRIRAAFELPLVYPPPPRERKPKPKPPTPAATPKTAASPKGDAASQSIS